ncbi:flagellar export chaperone FlgN [Acetohalobium arabaticum]|uniref:FlgN family protein n=1 Tax=Acetohalobium arabaticum (strain ATCC 49924 / DSM 5501 / Z-7288) TaxID=574087 RepID=D9QTP4_ACEAZ|nr:flagellar export chaperone FlgN [Acetohalobium arabaticum]ADL11808.1 hypothetical protein Acear_0258 [Acetohalobium arabaticum DSM 5501]
MKDNNDNLSIENLIKKLTNNYEEELNYYKEMLKLTNQQQQVIEDDEWQSLNQLVSRKRELMKKVDELEKQILSYQEKISAELNLQIGDTFYPELCNKDLPGTKKLKQVLINVYRLMQQIGELDKVNQARMEEKKKQKQQELNDVNQGLSVNRAYSGKSDSSEGKFIDQNK